MSGSHEKLPWLFWVQLVLVAIVAVLFFMLRPTGHGVEDAGGAEHAASSQALKPIGEVAVSSDAASGGSERTGKEIVEKTCQSCHAHGIANAPKMDESAKSVWEARLANGMDAMLEIAKTGKGAMPPMGADPSLSDAELEHAIVYMMDKAGVDTSSLSGASVSASNEAADEAAKPEAVIEAAPVPSTPEVEAKPEPTSKDMGIAPAAPSAPVAPEPPGSAGTTPAVATSNEAPVVEAAPVVAVAAAPEAEAKPAIDGAKLYSTTCFACHDTGAAGAPKTGDKPVWEARIAKGIEVLYEAAIKGTVSAAGVMPAKGGYMDLSDDEVKAIVDYMVTKSQ